MSSVPCVPFAPCVLSVPFVPFILSVPPSTPPSYTFSPTRSFLSVSSVPCPPFNPSVLYIFSDLFIPFHLICPMFPLQPLRLIHFLRLVHSFPSHLSHVSYVSYVSPMSPSSHKPAPLARPPPWQNRPPGKTACLARPP